MLSSVVCGVLGVEPDAFQSVSINANGGNDLVIQDELLLCSPSTSLAHDFDTIIRRLLTEKLGIVARRARVNASVLSWPLSTSVGMNGNSLDSLQSAMKRTLNCVKDGGKSAKRLLMEAGTVYARAMFNMQHADSFPWADRLNEYELRYVDRWSKMFGLDVATAVSAYLKDEEEQDASEAARDANGVANDAIHDEHQHEPRYIFSSFAFSFRAQPGAVGLSAGRAFFGQTFIHDSELESLALEVLRSRGLVSGTPLHWPAAKLFRHGLAFYSIGWDWPAGLLKLYLFFSDRAWLPADATALIAHVPAAPYRRSGLISYSYPLSQPSAAPRAQNGHNELKVYLYPHGTAMSGTGEPPAPVGSEAHMFSSMRGKVVQYDLPWDEEGGERQRAAQQWRALLDDRGKDALSRAAQDGVELDTITYVNSSDYTLYLPGY